jgi:hypothetical protein
MTAADLLLGREPLDTAIPRKRQRAAKAPAASERAIQIAIRDALRWHGIRSRHVPNGGKRSVVAGRRLRQEGMVAGFPDLIVWVPGGRIGFLEIKAAKGRVSEAQEREIAQLREDGFPAEVVRSVDEALAAVRKWGWLR